MTCRLYLITPPRFDPEVFKPKLMDALDGGDVAVVQLRLKDENGEPAPRAEVEKAAKAIMALVQDRDIAFLINDDPYLARDLRADGVHIGQSDASFKDARKAVGKDCIVGVTCHASTHLAMSAAEQGADYVAFGAFFPTTTKETSATPDKEILKAWSVATNVPSVAIGGINQQNCGELAEAGADFVAVLSAVWDHPKGPGAAVREFNKALA